MRPRLLATVLVFAPALAVAADWPQWRGPNRDEISTEPVRTNFGSEGPKLLWSYEKAGEGYSSPSIVGNLLYCVGAEDKDFAFCMNTDTHEQIWRSDLGERFTQDKGNGPRGTPTVDGELMFLIRGRGDLHCLSTTDGKEVWHKSFTKDFGGKIMSGWGYSESPLVDGEKLVCTPGGNKGALVALNKKTGELIWQSKELQDDAAYSSPIVADVDGVRQYIQQTRQGVGGFRAEDGKMLWFVEIPKHRTAVIPTPIYHDHHVYVTAGYGCGCDLIKLTKTGDEFKAEKLYDDNARKNLVNHHGGVVLLGDYIYGHSDAGGWTCQDLNTGAVKARLKGGPGKGSLTSAANTLFCYDEKKGDISIVKASPTDFTVLSSFKLPKKSAKHAGSVNYWTHPVISNGRLYVRDQDLIFCFDVKK
jgi:outer membrane protein assembly factor BamB